MSTITYQLENNLAPGAFRKVLIDSTLGERRPVDDLDRIEAMCRQADIIMTARDSEQLVGVARAISDFSYCTYLSDLAVIEAYQHQGIGRRLVQKIREAAPDATLILLAAPKAVNYYPKIGMTRHEAAFVTSAHSSDNDKNKPT